MITKKEMDNILSDVNRVLSNYDSRVSALEKEVEALKPAKKSSPVNKSENKA